MNTSPRTVMSIYLVNFDDMLIQLVNVNVIPSTIKPKFKRQSYYGLFFM